jgi:hypothetical protein
MKRELAIAYRIYPGLSPKATYFSTKLDLARLALRSFRDALYDVDYVLYAILDDCPDGYESLFRELFPAERLKIERHSPKLGNGGSWLRQIELLSGQEDAEMVLFAEDDYLWLPGSIRVHVDLHRNCPIVDFSSPYDHPGWYYGPLLSPPDRHGILFFEGRHWRTAACTTLTFLTRRALLRQTRRTMKSFACGCHDMSLWISLTKHCVFSPAFMLRGIKDPKMGHIFRQAWRMNFHQTLLGQRYSLWAPLPGLATHLEGKLLAPGVDWILQMQRYQVPEGGAECRSL